MLCQARSSSSGGSESRSGRKVSRTALAAQIHSCVMSIAMEDRLLPPVRADALLLLEMPLYYLNVISTSRTEHNLLVCSQMIQCMLRRPDVIRCDILLQCATCENPTSWSEHATCETPQITGSQSIGYGSNDWHVVTSVSRPLCAFGQCGRLWNASDCVGQLRGQGTLPGVPGQRGGGGLSTASGRLLLAALAQVDPFARD